MSDDKLKLDPKPADKVRAITTYEGKFLSLQQMKERLREVGVADQALAVMSLGHERRDNPRAVIAAVIGDFLRACAGEDPLRDRPKRPDLEDPETPAAG